MTEHQVWKKLAESYASTRRIDNVSVVCYEMLWNGEWISCAYNGICSMFSGERIKDSVKYRMEERLAKYKPKSKSAYWWKFDKRGMNRRAACCVSFAGRRNRSQTKEETTWSCSSES